MNEEPCIREYLEVLVDIPTYYTVDDEGNPEYSLDYECAPLDDREYYCTHCHKFFDTWAEALGHLKEKQQ